MSNREYMTPAEEREHAEEQVREAESMLAEITADWDRDDLARLHRAWEAWPDAVRAATALTSDADAEWWSTFTWACARTKRRDLWDSWQAAMPRAQAMVDTEIERLVEARAHHDQFQVRTIDHELLTLRNARKAQREAVARRTAQDELRSLTARIGEQEQALRELQDERKALMQRLMREGWTAYRVAQVAGVTQRTAQKAREEDRARGDE